LLNLNNLSVNVNLWDKANHFAAYAVFAILASLASKNRMQYYGLLLLTLCFGIAIEGLQSLSPHRTASLLDILANSLGLLAGFCLQAGYHFLWQKLTSSPHKSQA
jgi:VanZ family protein